VHYEQSVNLQNINNLGANQALPAAVWNGQQLPDIVGSLLEAVVRVLRLDFGYVRLCDSLADPPIELIRLPQGGIPAVSAEQFGRDLWQRLGGSPPSERMTVPNPLGEGIVHIAPVHFGLQQQTGVAIAASRRNDFPTESEMLLLRVASNHAAIGLQEARALNRHRQSPDDLQQRVAQRTVQLIAANLELNRAIIERKRAEAEALALKDALAAELSVTEAALAQAQADLARVMRVTMMGELAASIAHEVNQPLAAVAANGSACRRWLAAVPPNVTEASDAADRIIRDTARASEVISRIRGFLKRGDLRKTALNIGEVIREVIAFIEDKLNSQAVELRIDIAPDTPQVVADRVQLQQVLLNLMLNALEAMQEVPQPRILQVAAAEHDTGWARIAVSDSGVGIEAEQRENISSAFFTTKTDSMGMGLAISRSIIEGHRGRLWAMKNDGRGESFQFVLPAAGCEP
jgi:C4-dicarboxylate-specific signal transduction histidine kinase